MPGAYRVYTVEAAEIAVTVAADIVELTPADDKPIAIIGRKITQHTEFGDAAEELIRFRTIRGHTSSGSGGTATTPRALNPSDAAAGFTAETFNTTAATTGTTQNLSSQAFNVRVGEIEWLPPEAWIWASQANTTLIDRMLAAPADSISFSITYYVAEAG